MGQDYIRYNDRAAALGGIVQAKLMTNHMLFIGFSLTDDNFFRIADTVRKSLPANTVFGTSLMLEEMKLQQELWEGQLQFVNIADKSDSPDYGILGRHLTRWVDYLCMLIGDKCCPILDRRFDTVKTQGQVELANSLEAFLGSTTGEARNTHDFAALN